MRIRFFWAVALHRCVSGYRRCGRKFCLHSYGPIGEVYCFWNVMAYAQKRNFVFPPNGRVHLNRRGRHFNRLPAAELCASAVVMLDTPCSEVVWRVLATHSIRQFPLHLLTRASPCAITFQLESNTPPPLGTIDPVTQCHIPAATPPFEPQNLYSYVWTPGTAFSSIQKAHIDRVWWKDLQSVLI